MKIIKRPLLFAATLAATSILSAAPATAKNAADYAAHEWGTFTSVQGGDGALLSWRPLESSRLPKFVYDWKQPGLNRQAGGVLAFGKGMMQTLQRMETPVIYFYADHEQTVDVTVNFPKGLITEWYPQADQIGPASLRATPAGTASDNHLIPAAVPESRARWSRINILPGSKSQALAKALPFDPSGSHYFAARDTDASYLRVNSLAATNVAAEHEKFIFYRGAGSFGTPLRVTMTSEHAVTVANTGPEPLVHLFVLGLHDRAGKFIHLDRLAPGEERTVQLASQNQPVPLKKLSRQLGDQVASSLASQGLYPREAAAMVHTWEDSWFAEDGLRVLYLLPRAWTDRTLPLTLNPPPRELVRVMVGRAEVLTPALEQALADALAKAKQGDKAARAQVVAELKKLGRFAEPALSLAIKKSDPKINEIAWQLFQAAARGATEPKPL